MVNDWLSHWMLLLESFLWPYSFNFCGFLKTIQPVFLLIAWFFLKSMKTRIFWICSLLGKNPIWEACFSMEIIFLAVSESPLCGDGFPCCISSLPKNGVGFLRMKTSVPSSLLSRAPASDSIDLWTNWFLVSSKFNNEPVYNVVNTLNTTELYT